MFTRLASSGSKWYISTVCWRTKGTNENAPELFIQFSCNYIFSFNTMLFAFPSVRFIHFSQDLFHFAAADRMNFDACVLLYKVSLFIVSHTKQFRKCERIIEAFYILCSCSIWRRFLSSNFGRPLSVISMVKRIKRKSAANFVTCFFLRRAIFIPGVNLWSSLNDEVLSSVAYSRPFPACQLHANILNACRSKC